MCKDFADRLGGHGTLIVKRDPFLSCMRMDRPSAWTDQTLGEPDLCSTFSREANQAFANNIAHDLPEA